MMIHRVDLTSNNSTIYDEARRLYAGGAFAEDRLESYRNGALVMVGIIGVLMTEGLTARPERGAPKR